MDYCPSKEELPKSENLEILFYMVKKKGMKPIIFRTPLNLLEDKKTQIGELNKGDFIELVRYLFDWNVCAGRIGAEFLDDEDFATKNNLIMILLDKRTHNKTIKGLRIGRPLGFIVGRTKVEDFYGNPTTECYLDLVCSCPGTGAHLIDYFIKYSEANNYDAVSLSSIDNVITYYHSKFGFENRHSCVTKNERIFVPSPELIELMKTDYRDTSELAEMPKLFEYLERLRQDKFGKMDDDCNPDNNPILTAKDYQKYRCGSEGWMMRRCHSKRDQKIPIKMIIKKKK